MAPKVAYKATNKQSSFLEQMFRFVDRVEKVRLLPLLVKLGCAAVDGLERIIQELLGVYLPTPLRDVFKSRNSLCSDTMAFRLRQRPNHTDVSIADAQRQYELPSLWEDFRNHFLGARAHPETNLPFDSIDTWERVRTQLRDPQDPELVLTPATIEACPRIEGGHRNTRAVRCNFVLLHPDARSNNVAGAEGMEHLALNGESSPNYYLRLQRSFATTAGVRVHCCTAKNDIRPKLRRCMHTSNAARLCATASIRAKTKRYN